eukprot:m.76629 g.76629  ORF g.76629 m.76629 type:complete len:55 (-) comp12493_c0_seq1:3699-3863(-)
MRVSAMHEPQSGMRVLMFWQCKAFIPLPSVWCCSFVCIPSFMSASLSMDIIHTV